MTTLLKKNTTVSNSNSMNQISILIASFIIFTALHATSSQSTNTNATEFTCARPTTCKTFVIYRTQSPNYLDLGRISDLFSISRLSIMKANDLLSEDIIFRPNQLIYIPVTCACSNNQSFYNTSYYIKSEDSFYFVSITAYQNLTNFESVQTLNPELDPTKLKIGQEVVFPIFCKCPSKQDLDRGFNFLVTYVWQSNDDLVTVSKRMSTSIEDLMLVNNYRNFSAAVALPIVVPMTRKPLIDSSVFENGVGSSQGIDGRGQNHKNNHVLVVLVWLLGSILASIVVYLSFTTFLKGCSSKLMIRMNSNLETKNLLRSSNTFSTDPSLSPKIFPPDKLLTGVTEYIDRQIMFETNIILSNIVSRLSDSMYQATINKEAFAVKQSKGDITSEVNVLRMVNHANLVKLVGVSEERENSCFLVYEFVENGSLDKWLYQSAASSQFLSWKQRLSIALDVANGLQYMHEHTRPCMVHKDIRTKNVLLNSKFKAKISNFSLSSFASISNSPTIDVFGFGTILLELLSGRRVMETSEEGKVSMLWKEIRSVMQKDEDIERKLKEWMDPRIAGTYSIASASCIASMARACTLEDAESRPKISEIVFSLSVLAHSSSSSCGFEEFNFSSAENIQIICPPLAR